MEKRGKALFEEKILNQIGKYFDRSGVSGKAPVYHLIKDAIEKALTDVPPDTKLPSIRQIADKINVTGVSVQKAVKALVGERTLYSKAKSGIFISEKKYHENMKFAHDSLGRLKFATDSVLPYQRKLWTYASESFSELLPDNSAVIDYEFFSNYDKPGIKLPDALECSEWTLNTRTPEKPFLNLKEFLSVESDLNITLVNDVLLPLYHKISCVLYVPELMKKYKLKLPSFRTYDEQIEYFSEIESSLKKINGSELILKRPSFSTFSRKTASAFMENLKRDDSGPSKTERLAGEIRKLKEFSSGRIVASQQQYSDTLKRFSEGSLPVIICDSSEVWQFLSDSGNTVGFHAWPLLNMDNECVSMPIAGAVFAETLFPVECIRFFLHLLSVPMQKKFSSAGHVTHDGEECSLFENGTDAFALFRKAFRKNHDTYIFTQTEHYIKYCILDVEVYKYISGMQTLEETLKRSFMLSRAFINSRKHGFGH